ncbi:MAG TPA: asparagine synthase (glutamine-hydrolyzing) [Thermoanaerobaculia bacterium]|nr:asparagine synthase (glutamine-hydrolyzing) [Thermoanaerobaculia bacterium]
MCGFVGYVDLRGERMADRELLVRMTDKLVHRGPDSAGFFVEGAVGLGFRRLSIIDIETGDQPIWSEDGSLVLLCTGEIYNYLELRRGLEERGHVFATRSDVEVLLHLYEECGPDLLARINGQFAFVLFDRRRQVLFLARDHFGVTPLYYATAGGFFLFGSEIKALLEHPAAPRQVDLTGLDQVLCLPGVVSPRTLFKGIESLKSGHRIVVQGPRVEVAEYWDLDYPLAGELPYQEPESSYVERLSAVLERSVAYRLQSDVPIGLYLSGGLDSSLVTALACRLRGAGQHTFSISFTDRSIDETRYQRLMVERLGTIHHEIRFDWQEIASRLRDMVYHCECPVRESYNTCSMALSSAARQEGIKVILGGEGADEIFAGYPGYVFDQMGPRRSSGNGPGALREQQLRERLWGDPQLFYEIDLHSFGGIRETLYSAALEAEVPTFDCLSFPLINPERLRGRHPIHQRSYLDFKLRLADHLLADHGDRMVLANSVEGRYPFLDLGVVDLVREIPPDLKVHNFVEKYILKKLAVDLVPPEIIAREKFGFRAPGSPYLLAQGLDWIDDLLSYDRIKRQGYFDPDKVAGLRARAAQAPREAGGLNPHLETDFLMIVLTFNLLCELFDLPEL